MGFRYNGTRYYYEKNLQGDIIAIYDESGNKVGGYVYDAWGNTVITTDVSGIATVNPFRYRGYYFDSDLGLYYLKSRYYDAQVGRFINADEIEYLGANKDLGAYNLFAYCGSSPISRGDVSGNAWESIFDILSLGASILDVAFNPADPWAWIGLAGDVVDLIPFLTGVGETIRILKTSSKLVEGTDDAIDTYRNLRKINKGSGLEMHHIVEKRFKLQGTIDIDSVDDMLSIALSKADHQVYTSDWRKLLPYGSRYTKKEILQAAIDIYSKTPELLGAAIFTIVK